MSTTLELLNIPQHTAAPATTVANPSLRDCVKNSVQNYLSQLDGQNVSNVYDLVLSEIEEPLLQAIMHFTDQNQSRAAVILGVSRGTLRKMLEKYGMLISSATRNNNEQ
jgi:Fis family transcriptional regulator